MIPVRVGHKKVIDLVDTKFGKVGQQRLFRFAVVTAVDHDDRIAGLDQVGISLQFARVDVDHVPACIRLAATPG